MAGKATNRAYAQEGQMKNAIHLNPPDQWAVVIWCKSRKHARETKGNVDNGLRKLQIMRLPRTQSASSRPRDTPEFLALIERVRRIDPKAAKYMEVPHEGINEVRTGITILGAWALWSQTPQGHHYWSRISAIVD